MKPVVLDKIASVTSNCRLSREVRLAPDFPCQEGDVVAVRVLNAKSVYNQLELTTGRFSTLKPGDVLAGALGHRNALGGYAGHIPESLAPGDRINILNLGGVLGICDSINPSVGAPFECEALGQVLHFPFIGERVGIPANIGQGQPDLDADLEAAGVPVVMVVGTCMDSGKTWAACALIQELAHQRKVVHAAKATGVSLRRDVLAMEDAGAQQTLVFTDLGAVTTTQDNAPDLMRTMINRLAADDPDVIIVELGDGLLGTYGVDTILADPVLRRATSAFVLCANDPVGAWGGLRCLREQYDIDVAVVTGPATDNVAGTALIEGRFEVPARNARTQPKELAEVLLATLPGAEA